jgi:regulatory protein
MPRTPPAPPSLKAQALALLARREHSRAELRERLLDHARKLAAHAAAAAALASGESSPAHARSDSLHSRSRDKLRVSDEAQAEVDAVLDWLQSERHQSDSRFMEALVHRLAPGAGQNRIRHALSQHGLALSADLVEPLKDSEFERARALWLRRYRTPALADAERARQLRFLLARGFSVDIVRRVIEGRED